MKKVDILFDPTAVYVTPPEPIDENEPIDLVDYMIPRNKDCIFYYNKCAVSVKCRLSVEDIKYDKSKKKNGREDESNSISNQKQILLDYCKKTRIQEHNVFH